MGAAIPTGVVVPVILDMVGGLDNLVSVIIGATCTIEVLTVRYTLGVLTLTFGVIIAVGVEVVPNSLLTIAMASSLPPSQVMATVLVAVVGVGLTTLLRVDILPWLFSSLGSLISLVVLTRQQSEIVGVIVWVV